MENGQTLVERKEEVPKDRTTSWETSWQTPSGPNASVDISVSLLGRRFRFVAQIDLQTHNRRRPPDQPA